MKPICRRTFLSTAGASGGLLILGAYRTEAKDQGIAKNTPKGQILYTKFTLYYEDLRHRTTNYRKGILVPVNTEVKYVKAKGQDIFVTLPNGQELKIENVEPFSGENIDGIFSRTFGTEKVDLSQFTDEEKRAIALGEVEPGMRKSAVLVALGYPPKHKTPTLDSPEWRYWRNRFATFVVQFEGDKVLSIKK